MQKLKQMKCSLCLFVIGGLAYNLIEILWRGYSHWTMFCVGGLCFHVIGRIQTRCRKWRLIYRCMLCSAGITTVEFLSGCLVNLRWKLEVWDYSSMPGNLLGQVCILYTVLWGGLSVIAMPLYDKCKSFVEGFSNRRHLSRNHNL